MRVVTLLYLLHVAAVSKGDGEHRRVFTEMDRLQTSGKRDGRGERRRCLSDESVEST